MSTKSIPESKSADGYYGMDYQENMVSKYKNRADNHRKSRINLAHQLVDRFVLPRFSVRKPNDIVCLDVGCSIGTFAIEFAKRGFKTFGVDFSPSAIELAKKLAKEEGVDAEFICGDILDLKDNLPKFDIVSCFDIFEHLHDDELGVFLVSLRSMVSDKGCLIFHTYPTQYDHIFFGKRIVRWPMIPFSVLPSKYFNRIVKAYTAIIDAGKIILKGGSQRELVKSHAHCNITTPERISEIFDRAGWEVLFIETNNLCEYNKVTEKIFSKQPIVYRDIQGVVSLMRG